MGGLYNINLIETPANRFTAAAYRDVAELLRDTLESLSCETAIQINRFDSRAINIVLGDHLLTDPGPLRDHQTIIYQLEPLPGQQGWLRLTDERLAILKAAAAVWDYSPANIALLTDRGLPGVRLLPIGYHPKREVVPDAEPEFDVLFYGAINRRRKVVLDALAAQVRVKTVFGVYGEKRDRLIGKSKIVLNVHANPGLLMEQPRLAHLLNNRRFVVSEESPDDPYAGSVLTVAYAEIADTCLRYLDDPAGRTTWASRGHEALKTRPMTDLLRAVLT